ncbi:MAG TPA: hypothetical protein PKY87_08065 [Terricaulis sp.]|nr:hypothetical protein [Terricaulis sp.]
MQAAKLSAFIGARRQTPFEWGGSDCCLLGADWLLEVSGRDFAHDLRGRYASGFGALRRVRELGFLCVGNLVRARLRQVYRPRLGALALTEKGPLESLLICDSAQGCWGQDEAGLVRGPIPPRATFWEAPECPR